MDGQWHYDNGGREPVVGTWEFSGVVSEGRNPRVSLDLDDGCGTGGFLNFSGTCNTEAARLLLSGIGSGGPHHPDGHEAVSP